MRIGVMLRTLDEKGGVGVYSRNLIGSLLEIDDRNDYELFTAAGNILDVMRAGATSAST